MKKLKVLGCCFALLCICSMTGCGKDELSIANEAESLNEAVEVVDFDSEEDTAGVSATSGDNAYEGNISENEILKGDVSDNEISKEDVSDSKATDIEVISDNEALTAEAEKTIDDTDFTIYDEPVLLYSGVVLNVRKGPGTDFEALGRLNVNDEVSVIGESKSTAWKKVNFTGVEAYVNGDYLVAEKIVIEPEIAAAVSTDAATLEPQPEVVPQSVPSAEEVVEKKPEPVVINPAGVLFIGDSRTCQMKAASGGGGCSWICEYSMKYDWFEETAVPLADTMVGKGTKVVICMGVNDPDNCSSYASLVNRKAGEWNARGAKVYYVSINPVEAPYDFKYNDIEAFNTNMPSLLSGVKWIDTASIIKQGGYTLEDGIHYDAVGNANIFKMIYSSLK